MKRRRFAAAAGVAVSAPLGGCLTGCWRLPRDPGDDGRPDIPETDWPTYPAGPANWGFHPRADGPGASPTERWRFDPEGESSFSRPVVADGTVYVGQTSSPESDSIPALYALDAGTGRRHWQFQLPDVLRGTLSVVGGRVYLRAGRTEIYALDAGTGERHWQHEIETSAESPPTGGPTVADGTVYVTTGRYLTAIDADSGAERWTYEVQSAGDVWMVAPAVLHDTVYVTSHMSAEDDRLFALDVEDGTERWRVAGNAVVGDAPTVAGDTVYAGSYVPTVDDHEAEGRVVAYAVDDGSERWRASTRDPAGGLTTDGDTLVAVTSPETDWIIGGLVAVSRTSCVQQWRRVFEGRVPTRPAIGNDTAYVGLDGRPGGRHFLVALDVDDGDERWRFELATHLGPRSPVVTDGRVYISTDAVHALE